MNPIIDTHTHVVSSDTDRFPLRVAADIPHDWVRDHRLTAHDLLREMDGAGVSGAVLVQARAAYGYDNSYVAAARFAAPARLVSTAIVDMAAADRDERLCQWRERGVGGLRLFNIPPATPSWLEDAALAPFVRTAGESGVRVSACILAPDLGALGQLLGRVPGVPVALDHCGFAELGESFEAPQARELVALAAHENALLKVTTTYLRMATDIGVDARDVVEWLCGTFGAHRLMWGSDRQAAAASRDWSARVPFKPPSPPINTITGPSYPGRSGRLAVSPGPRSKVKMGTASARVHRIPRMRSGGLPLGAASAVSGERAGCGGISITCRPMARAVDPATRRRSLPGEALTTRTRACPACSRAGTWCRRRIN